MGNQGTKKQAILGFICLVGLLYLVISFISFVFEKEYTIDGLKESPIFNMEIFSDWKENKGKTFIYNGYINEIDENEMTIVMEEETSDNSSGKYEYNVIFEDKNELSLSSYSRRWSAATEGDYVVIIGELEKVKDGIFSGRCVYLDNWFFDAEEVRVHYEEIERQRQEEEEMKLLLEGKAEAPYTEIQENYLNNEYTAILTKIDEIKSLEVTLENYKDIVWDYHNVLSDLKDIVEKYPYFSAIDEVQKVIDEIDNVILSTQELGKTMEFHAKIGIDLLRKENVDSALIEDYTLKILRVAEVTGNYPTSPYSVNVDESEITFYTESDNTKIVYNGTEVKEIYVTCEEGKQYLWKNDDVNPYYYNYSKYNMVFEYEDVIKKAVKNKLAYPSTAKFPGVIWSGEWVTGFDYEEDIFIIQSYVDSKNAFGVEIRNYFQVHIRANKGQLQIIDIVFFNR